MHDGNIPDSVFENATWVPADPLPPREDRVRRSSKERAIEVYRQFVRDYPEWAMSPIVEPDTLPEVEPWKTPQPDTPEPPRTPRRNPFRPPQPEIDPLEPSRTPRRNPFRPPQPEIDPSPQNRMHTEAYTDEVHPSTQKFFRSSDHPVLKNHGPNLAEGSFNWNTEHATRRKLRNLRPRSDRDMMAWAWESMQLYSRIVAIERQHQRQLENLARELVSEVWGVPLDMLDPRICDQSSVEDNDTAEALENEPDVIEDDRVKGHIHMRQTMNMLTHGAGIYHMATLHHMAAERLQTISPELLSLYDKISSASFGAYWFMNIEDFLGILHIGKAGSVRVEYQQDEAADDGESSPVVKARAVIFPVLIQELSKGVAQVISHHHIGRLDRATLATVLKKSDDVNLEPYLTMVGPEMWRRLLTVLRGLPDMTPAEAMTIIAEQEPNDAHELMDNIVAHPEIAQARLQALANNE